MTIEDLATFQARCQVEIGINILWNGEIMGRQVVEGNFGQ